MSRFDYAENPKYPQDFKFPDTVNNKIKYHYLDTTFVATTNQNSFVAEMMTSTSTLLKNYKNVKSVELIHAVLHTQQISQPILYMFIKEFDNVIDSTQTSGVGAFTKLFFNEITVDNHGGQKAKIAYIHDNMNPTIEWDAKGKRIDRLTISFKLFNVATPLQFVTNDIISLTFKIGVIEPVGPR